MKIKMITRPSDSKVFLTLAAICFCLVPASPLFGQNTPNTEAVASAVANDNYKIGPGDIIDITVSKNVELSRSGLRVSNKGTIQLAMLDTDLPAACLSERELADAVKEKYRKYLVNPYVNVSVKEFNSNPVAVIGAVNAPGRFQLQRSIRLAELLTFVNGPSMSAGRTVDIIRNSARPYCEDVKLVIPIEGGEELLSVTLDDTFKGGEQANPMILAGDIVKVEQADQVNAYIQGNIKSAMAIPLKEPVSLTQAVAMAGGLAPGAQTEKIKIRRQVPGSINRSEMVVNLKEILKGTKDDVLLQPNDIIDIPGPTGGKKFLQDMFKTIIPSMTRLPLSVIP